MLILLAWTLAHLAFSFLEIIVTPLYPWDAWTVWVYRAKAWFLNGQFVDFVTPWGWLKSASSQVYTSTGLGYPKLVSILPFWAATGLGEWHEALINIPVLFCGLAIVAGLYGQCRAVGLGMLPSLAFAYLLMSTPLFGTHVSLAGYADIWMAGFAGLGFIALLRGVSEQRLDQTLTGFALLAAGLLVKDEGLIWLLAAVAVYLLASVPWRIQLIAGATALVAGAVLWALGLTLVELPGIGRVGLRNDILWVPGAGGYKIMVNDVLDAYLKSAFTMGTWNLAWLMVLVGLVLALFGRAGRPQRVAAVFMLVFAMAQAAIFVFSSEGMWARDYTAINRLPLHLYPALLFAVALAVKPYLATGQVAGSTGISWRMQGAAIATSLVIVLAAFGIWLKREYAGQEIGAVALQPESMTAVAGRVEKTSAGVVADGFQDGIILLSSGPVSINANAQKLLRLDLQIDKNLAWPEEAPAFYWRRKGMESVVSRVTLDGAPLVDLSVSKDWKGVITEVGFLFLEHGGEPAKLGEVSLEGRSFASSIRLLPVEWFEFEPWSQRSGNFLFGGAPGQKPSLTLLLVAWAALAILILAVAGRKTSAQTVSAIACLFLFLWMLADLRWTANRARQMGLSLESLTSQTVEERISASELGKFYPWVSRVRGEFIGPDPARVLLVLDPAQNKYFGLRSKYQLLPHSVNVVKGLDESMLNRGVDYVIFLGQFGAGISEQPSREEILQRAMALPVADEWRKALELVDVDSRGLLFRVSPAN